MGRTFGGAVVASVVVGLAACTGATPEVPEPPERGALDAYLAPFSWEDEAFYAAQQLEEQEHIAACMADLGFEYIPYVQPALGSTEIDPPHTSREYAALYGYGYLEQHPDENGSSEDFDIEANPNYAIVVALTPGETEAYYLALDGAGGGWTYDATKDDPLDPAEFGCHAAAVSRAPSGVLTDPTFRAAMARQDEILEAASQDPRVLDAAQRRTECMAEAGFAELDPDTVWTYIFEQEALEDVHDAEGELTAYGEQLAAEERAIAVADWDCRESSGYDAWLAVISDELEREYVTAHQAELDAMLETWAP
mgnify:CR=1 FL=1